MKFRCRLAAFLVAGCVSLPAAVWADSAAHPAVAAPNFDLAVGGGVSDGDGVGLLAGKAAVPVGHAFGVQIDSAAVLEPGDSRGGLGAHVFYRDPSRFLVGGTAMWGHVDGENIYRAGPEAEIYVDDVTLYAGAGWQDGMDNSTGYGKVRLSYYATDNFVFAVRAEAFSDHRSGGIDVEWLPQRSPVSVFLVAGDTNESDGYALAGVRASFGTQGRTLKERHRFYDPINIVETFTVNEGGGLKKKDPAPPVVVPF